MQKVLQRTVRAERVATRRHAKERLHRERGEGWERAQSRNRLIRVTGSNIKAARLNRQEDWERGPLAPRRNVGEQEETYGAMNMFDLHTPELEKKAQPKWCGISQGDRVVVMRGRDKGRIGSVQEVMMERGQLRVKGVNVTDVVIPEWMNREDNTQGVVQQVPRAIPMEDVRLVYPLPDPETGIVRDVIVDRLVRVNSEYYKVKKEWTEGDRLIPGTNTLVPWPEKADPDYEDHDDDTLRITVEEQTSRPFLLHPPMPLTVIDELRNKFSRFRTRHDWEYLDKKEAEDAAVEKRKELVKGMRTPLQQLAEVRKARREREERELSAEQLAKIGEVIEAEKGKVVGRVERGRIAGR